MKHLAYLIICVFSLIILFQECANPGRPTGGPKDTIPPILISSNPMSGTINFKESTIELEFSEYINSSKLKQELIITPKSDLKYKAVAKRNKLVIKFEDELLDSTTYYFNFANGVTDITESNPAVNLAIAFSTGNYIDSMSVDGKVEELLTQEPGAGYVISLFPYTDTLDYFTDTPLYFTTANDSGRYSLNYLKIGQYKVIGFNDDNGNFLLDPETESHGFIEQVLQLDSPTSIRPIRSILQNIKPLTLINVRPTGRYVEIKFNKHIQGYEFVEDSVSSNIIGENKDIIRLYKPEDYQYGDSIQNIIYAFDSLGNEVNDTIKYVFLESNRKPSGFSFGVPSSTPLENELQIPISFNKPIERSYLDSIYFRADSIYTYFPISSIDWNQNSTRATLNLTTDTDSLYSGLEQAIPPDTAQVDSTVAVSRPQRPIELLINKNSFVSVDGDSSRTKKIPIRALTEYPYGTLKLSIQTDLTSFVIQLVDKAGAVKYEKWNEKQFTFPRVRPESYQIRILIDTDNDGEWSYGNLLDNQEPEEIYLYPEEISIRENWEVLLDISL